ncbi:sigma-54-dependent transcriptional regulator [Aliagarivorans marinus]|uniref:sigma-54-dependent transcriptional regulator n=1 Tax=Aliagarivorans marinus TaxID=561965 RepID=UPI000426A5DC|nr:sigma 54-interacting transcriptional regulator [Aliagarivorans marinus]
MNEPKTCASHRILVVDDDPSLLRLISMRLQANGYQVVAAESAKQALAELESQSCQLVISDVRMPQMDGMDLFGQLKRLYPGLPVILLTAHGSIPDAVEATQQGVFAYLTKPYEAEQLLTLVASACQRAQPRSGNTSHDAQPAWRQAIVTANPQMHHLLEQLGQLALSELSLVLRGESGTGKELFAQGLHQASPRSKGAFIEVNCGAIPEELFESELFGHVKGAFSGATRDHKGLIQSADGGTLFLDEIAELPLSVQVKLLRVLQERKVRPVGATQPIPVDFRLVCASHQDLQLAVSEGRFRDDLYYRINGFELVIPPLRERQEDIPLLISHFCQVGALASSKQFAPAAMALMMAANWPGNVRQLANVVQQLVILVPGELIDEDAVRRALREEQQWLGFSQAREQFERRYLAKLLRMTDGNVSHAAKLAERNRTEFYKLLERHQLKPEAYR